MSRPGLYGTRKSCASSTSETHLQPLQKISNADVCGKAMDSNTLQVSPTASEAPQEHGYEFWVSLRAKWLGTPEEEVAKLPRNFEDRGLLEHSRLVARKGKEVRSVTLKEWQALETCLESVDRPYPELKQSIPLSQAIACAVDVWDDS